MENHRYYFFEHDEIQQKDRRSSQSQRQFQKPETCRHYRIEFDEDQYHSAIYDVTKTLEILNKMSSTGIQI